MPVDFQPLILVSLILIFTIGLALAVCAKIYRGGQETAFGRKTRITSMVGLTIAFALLFFIYFLSGLRHLPKALRGSAQSQYELGKFFENGMNTGLFEFSILAGKWYQEAADQNHAHAQLQMGVYYKQGGGGVVRHYAQAIYWFKRAATNGVSEGATAAAWLEQEQVLRK